LYVGPDHRPYVVQRMRRHENRMIVHFAGLRDRDQAERLRNQFVYIHIDNAVPLEDGEYYLYQVEGIRVVSDEGQELGRLTGLIETGANDVYVVTSLDGGEILLPVIPQVIQNVDIPGGVMTVHLIEGLI
jgi:16S rRNA processing protein RimM